MNETIILALKLHIKNKVEMSVQNQKTILKYINKQDKEIAKLKAKLEMYENGVYFSSENDKLQQRIDKAIEYIEEKGRLKYKSDELINILYGSDKNE